MSALKVAPTAATVFSVRAIVMAARLARLVKMVSLETCFRNYTDLETHPLPTQAVADTVERWQWKYYHFDIFDSRIEHFTISHAVHY